MPYRGIADYETRFDDHDRWQSYRRMGMASRGLYLHPGSKDADIDLMWQAGIPKVVWQGGIPNGHWAFYPFPEQEWGASNLNSEQPVLSLKFNAQGIEEEHPKPAIIYAAVKGADHVYRAVGQCLPGDAGMKLYADHELAVMKYWHIMIVLQ